KAVGSCFILGLSCCLFFLVFGRLIGTLLFHSDTAGSFIITLAWICPFWYTNTSLFSAINGYGKTGYTFLIIRAVSLYASAASSLSSRSLAYRGTSGVCL